MFPVGVLLRLAVIASITSIHATKYDIKKSTEWWETATLYQIWPSSFQDNDGDGIGDINGIISRLEHFVDMGIEVIWISPFYPSPMVDSGYDVADYRNINPIYGTLEDFDNLVTRARELGLKVVLDYVPNHTSDQHEWFIKSKAGVEPYTDYYVWNKGRYDEHGIRQPPNSWLSVFNSGSAWEWVEERKAYYLHQFSVGQPDLNFRNPLVIQETKDILTFWLDRNIDGFRFDALPYLVEDSLLRNEPRSGLPDRASPDFYYLDHPYVKDQPESYEIVQIWRDHLDDYSADKGDEIVRVMFTEAYANITNIVKYYDYGSRVPFNFFFIKDSEGIENVVLDTATDVVSIINLWMENMPDSGTPNWVFGNHDNSRVATKLGKNRVDAVNFLLFLLPGVATIYNGDEIGMTDTFLTWEQTRDPQACNTDPDRYQLFSRDPARTPYQWDNTTSAGFSTKSTTTLPVNENYPTLNLEAQKEADVSHYKNVKAVIRLRSTAVIRDGSLDVEVIGDDVVAFSRELDGQLPIVVLANWANTTATASLDVFPNVPNRLRVLVADINSGITVGDIYTKTRITLPGNAAVVLEGIDEASNPNCRKIHRKPSTE